MRQSLRTVQSIIVLGLVSFTFIASASDLRDSDDSEEYNFSWLDPDKKVYVLQNRKYRKANRLAVFASAGNNLSNPFKTEYIGSVRGAFWLTEQFGIEGFFSFLTNSDNSTLKALKNVNSTALPFIRENRSYFGGVLSYTPWYAKLNFFNKILYLDWYFNLGLGQLSTAVDRNRLATGTSSYRFEDLMTVFFGVGQNFYVTKNILVRLDLVGMGYRATGADDVTEYTFTNFDFTAGVGFLF